MRHIRQRDIQPCTQPLLTSSPLTTLLSGASAKRRPECPIRAVGRHRRFLAELMTSTGVPIRGLKGIYIPPKLPKLDLTTDAEYVANLVHISV